MAIEVISCSAIELAFGKICGSAEVPVHCTSFTFHPRTQVFTLHAALFGKRRSFHVRVLLLQLEDPSCWPRLELVNRKLVTCD